eukprot:c49342_g1_i1 orf=3-248(-)
MYSHSLNSALLDQKACVSFLARLILLLVMCSCFLHHKIVGLCCSTVWMLSLSSYSMQPLFVDCVGHRVVAAEDPCHTNPQAE